MNLTELETRLRKTEIPYSHIDFIDTKQDPAPDAPPYVCYMYNEKCVGPDECPDMLKRIKIAVELYVERTNGKKYETLIENLVLYDQDYEKEHDIVNDENMLQVNYIIEVLSQEDNNE